MRLDIQLQPKQSELLNLVRESEYTIIGYGGSNGGAKSHCIRDVSLILSMQYPGINILVFRRLANDLLENHINPFFFKYPELRQYFNKTEKLIYYPNGSITKFGYADSQDDIYNFQGKEYDIIFIDEATHCTQEMIQFLRTRNRSKILPKAKMILTMNPGGVGHAYIKRIMIDKSYQENENPADYYFLPAKIYDNVIWCEGSLKEHGFTVEDYYKMWNDEQRKSFTYKYSDYAKSLAALPEELRLAFLEGDWDVFGGMFFKGFDKKKAEIDPFAIPKEWKLIGSLDPGYSSPCSFGLTAQDFKGNIYRIATYYESDRNPQQHAEAIKEFLCSENSLISKFTGGRKPDYIVSGRDAWARQDRYAILASDKTLADVFVEYGLNLLPAVTDRIPGWWAWKSLIPDRYFVFREFNKPLLEEMSGMITDDKYVEDIQGRGNDPAVTDHACDEQRYAIMSLFKPKEQIKKEPIARPFVERMKSEITSTTF